ncbi:MAG: hypothetical protein OXU20_11870 [Myxococcales bacterium]|nr:hypothetical protein [Myxococcales bacterium]MDD9970774.1 hypothetical protein [Myxococcales bacterium]
MKRVGCHACWLWLAIQLVGCENTLQTVDGPSDHPDARSSADNSAGQGAAMRADMEGLLASSAQVSRVETPSLVEDSPAAPSWPEDAKPPTCPSELPSASGEHGLWTIEECHAACGFVVSDPGDGSGACPRSASTLGGVQGFIEGGYCCHGPSVHCTLSEASSPCGEDLPQLLVCDGDPPAEFEVSCNRLAPPDVLPVDAVALCCPQSLARVRERWGSQIVLPRR